MSMHSRHRLRSGGRLVAMVLMFAAPLVRYAFAQGATIEVTPPGTAPAGATITVTWSGPNGPGDFITVVRQGARPVDYLDYRETGNGRAPVNPVRLVLPAGPGAYEIRYVRGTPRTVLATVPYEVTTVTATVDGPASVAPGARFEVAWQGPNGRGDWVTIVASGAAVRTYGSYVDALNGRIDDKTRRRTATLLAPKEPGRYELRYVQQGTHVIGTRPVEVTAAGGSAVASVPQMTAVPLSPSVLPLPTATAPSQPAARASAPSAASAPAGMTAIAGSRNTGVTFTEAPPTPGGMAVRDLRVRATSPADVALHWSCVTGSTGYEVFLKMNGGESVKITPTPLNPNCVQDLTQVNPGLVTPGSTPQTTYSKDFTQGGLTPGNDYTYVVRALYGSAGPADSAPVTVRLLFPPPGFQVWPANPGQVSISWDWARVHGDYAKGHVISRRLAGESTFRQLATLPYSIYNVYNDNGVPVGTHEYVVEAIDGMKGTPVTVTTGAVRIWQASVFRIVTVDLGFSGVWPGGTVRVSSAPQATGPFTDITAEGSLSNQHWSAVGQFGSNLHYKVAVSYPGGITYHAVAQVAVPQASNIGLTAEDAGGGSRLKWNCETDVARYELLRRTGTSGPFSEVGGYAFTVYPRPSPAGGPATCSYNDTTAPLGNLVEYIVIGFSSKQRGDNPIRAARTSVFVKTWP
jgi:hypothetical protein